MLSELTNKPDNSCYWILCSCRIHLIVSVSEVVRKSKVTKEHIDVPQFIFLETDSSTVEPTTLRWSQLQKQLAT
jgi:hypothetical protein